MSYLQNRDTICWMTSSWYVHDLTHWVSKAKDIPLIDINEKFFKQKTFKAYGSRELFMDSSNLRIHINDDKIALEWVSLDQAWTSNFLKHAN